ncbi:MAG: PAS domain S-box protein [Bacteroidota bacterium]
MVDNNKIIQDISLLYELSLAVGKSIDFKENCANFLKVLMARKSLSYAAVWIFEENSSKQQHLSLAYAMPAHNAKEKRMGTDHFIWQQLLKKNLFIIRADDPHFEACQQEQSIGSGSYVIYRLGDLGFLKLYSHKDQHFSPKEANQIYNVIKKFRLLLGGCLAHEQLKQEMAERSKIQQELNASETKLRKIIDASLDGVITIDEAGIVTEWNDQASKIFGYEREEAIGQDMSQLIVPTQFRESHRRGMEHFLKTGEGPVLNTRIEIVGCDKSGREFPIELSISPIRLGERHIFSGFIRDITERKKAEEELIAAKQAAEQAHLAEQQFLANMSHEIRTPMNAVIGMTHLMYETQPTESQREYLDSLRFSADSLMGIINNILDLSKIEAGELAFEKQTFDLSALLLALQQTFQFKLRDKAVSVTVDIDPQIENQLIGDSIRLNQILTNLLSNASKFTQKGTVGVRVKLLAQPADQYILEFEVHDTGIGIDQEGTALIFQSFKQADLGITRKYGGTGLGLAIVKQLVELQGGSIKVESRKGKGSIFTVVLPYQNSAIPQADANSDVTSEQDSLTNFDYLHLLVVEDNPMNQKLIGKILDLWHCPYDIANSGEEGLRRSRQKAYDLILMDIHMPEMDGCETTLLIRQDSDNPNADSPIIALTAAALLDEKNRALEAGMNDFLTKPFALEKLQKKIRHWTNSEKTKTTLQRPAMVDAKEMIKIDLNYLRQLGKDDEQFVQDMIQIFLTEIPLAMDRMKEAHQAEEWEEVASIAHRIKTNYMMVGMREQQDMALQIEKHIRKDRLNPDVLDPLVYRLRNDSKLAYPLLKTQLDLRSQSHSKR